MLLQQERMAELFEEIFGDRLLRDFVDDNERDCLPSPDEVW